MNYKLLYEKELFYWDFELLIVYQYMHHLYDEGIKSQKKYPQSTCGFSSLRIY